MAVLHDQYVEEESEVRRWTCSHLHVLLIFRFQLFPQGYKNLHVDPLTLELQVAAAQSYNIYVMSFFKKICGWQSSTVFSLIKQETPKLSAPKKKVNILNF